MQAMTHEVTRVQAVWAGDLNCARFVESLTMWGMLILNNITTLQAMCGAWTQAITMLQHKLRAEGTICGYAHSY